MKKNSALLLAAVLVIIFSFLAGCVIKINDERYVSCVVG